MTSAPNPVIGKNNLMDSDVLDDPSSLIITDGSLVDAKKPSFRPVEEPLENLAVHSDSLAGSTTSSLGANSMLTSMPSPTVTQGSEVQEGTSAPPSSPPDSPTPSSLLPAASSVLLIKDGGEEFKNATSMLNDGKNIAAASVTTSSSIVPPSGAPASSAPLAGNSVASATTAAETTSQGLAGSNNITSTNNEVKVAEVDGISTFTLPVTSFNVHATTSPWQVAGSKDDKDALLNHKASVTSHQVEGLAANLNTTSELPDLGHDTNKDSSNAVTTPNDKNELWLINSSKLTPGLDSTANRTKEESGATASSRGADVSIAATLIRPDFLLVTVAPTKTSSHDVVEPFFEQPESLFNVQELSHLLFGSASEQPFAKRAGNAPANNAPADNAPANNVGRQLPPLSTQEQAIQAYSHIFNNVAVTRWQQYALGTPEEDRARLPEDFSRFRIWYADQLVQEAGAIGEPQVYDPPPPDPNAGASTAESSASRSSNLRRGGGRGRRGRRGRQKRSNMPLQNLKEPLSEPLEMYEPDEEGTEEGVHSSSTDEELDIEQLAEKIAGQDDWMAQTCGGRDRKGRPHHPFVGGEGREYSEGCWSGDVEGRLIFEKQSSILENRCDGASGYLHSISPHGLEKRCLFQSNDFRRRDVSTDVQMLVLDKRCGGMRHSGSEFEKRCSRNDQETRLVKRSLKVVLDGYGALEPKEAPLTIAVVLLDPPVLPEDDVQHLDQQTQILVKRGPGGHGNHNTYGSYGSHTSSGVYRKPTYIEKLARRVKQLLGNLKSTIAKKFTGNKVLTGFAHDAKRVGMTRPGVYFKESVLPPLKRKASKSEGFTAVGLEFKRLGQKIRHCEWKTLFLIVLSGVIGLKFLLAHSVVVTGTLLRPFSHHLMLFVQLIVSQRAPGFYWSHEPGVIAGGDIFEGRDRSLGRGRYWESRKVYVRWRNGCHVRMSDSFWGC